MFIHNLKYSLKTIFRQKNLIFWSFAFPLILGTLFNLAFKDIEKNEKLDPIDIAIVADENFTQNKILSSTFAELSNEQNENRLFSTQYTTEREASNLLKNDEISGYLVVKDDTAQIIVKQNGINATILKYVTEEIIETSHIITDLTEDKIKAEITSGNTDIDYENIPQTIIANLSNTNANIKNISHSNLSYTMIEFYSLIAMTCLYAGIIAIASINQVLPNMGDIGKRVAISPLKKINAVISSCLASFITALIGLTILFLYTIFIIKVDYGTHLPLIILLGINGTLTGISIGLVIGTSIKTNDTTKSGILIAISMLGCFLSGMMGITMKYVVDKNIPIINKINPASMITDGFYSLYYYTTLERYWFNIISLLIFTTIMILISYINLRGQKYDSI